MTYQFLRIALCAVLLTSSSVHAVGKRALYDFVEAKKSLQKNLVALKALDSKAGDTVEAEKLIQDIQKSIDEVKKLNPTKAAEFQAILDGSFEQQMVGLELEALQLKQALEKDVETVASTIDQNVLKAEKAIQKGLDNEIPGIKEAKERGYLRYLEYVTVPVSSILYPFTRLIAKSYKMALRSLNFITFGKIESIHKAYTGILTQEQEALATTIVNTSLIAALKINSFLTRLTSFNQGNPSGCLMPKERWWYLGLKDKGQLRNPETFSGSQLHKIVLGELLEYGLLLTPVVNIEKHEALKNALLSMSENILALLEKLNDQESLTDDKNLICSLYEMMHTLKTADQEARNIKDNEGKSVYPEGKLGQYISFDDISRQFDELIKKALIDKTKLIDTRSYAEKVKSFAGKQGSKIAQYKDDVAALAGLVLTIAGGSYLVNQYLPSYANKYTNFASAPIYFVIENLKNAYNSELAVAIKTKSINALAVIRAKIPQLPFSSKINEIFQSSFTKASAIIASGSALMTGIWAKFKSGPESTAFVQSNEDFTQNQQETGELFFFQSVPMDKASEEAKNRALLGQLENLNNAQPETVEKIIQPSINRDPFFVSNLPLESSDPFSNLDPFSLRQHN